MTYCVNVRKRKARIVPTRIAGSVIDRGVDLVERLHYGTSTEARAVAVANKPGEFTRRGLISGVEKIEFPYSMAKNRELPNEEEVGLRPDEFTALLLHFVVSGRNVPAFAKAMAWQISRSRNLERVKGIEPSSQAWEAHILPLNHTRFLPTPSIYQVPLQGAIGDYWSST